LYSVKTDSKYQLRVLSIRDHTDAALEIQSTEPMSAGFSSDGHWLVYSSNPVREILSQRAGVFIQRFPGGDSHQVPKVSRDFHPVWNPRRMELLFVPAAVTGQIAAVNVTTSPSIAFDKPVMLPARVTETRSSGAFRGFDVMPDGGFVGLVDTINPEALRMFADPELRVVVNWFEELKQKVPVRR
jgi:hypothetical protein